jgi:hypothetical protein
VADLPTPLAAAARQQLPFHHTTVAGVFAAACAPGHRGDDWRVVQAADKQAEPVQPGDTEWTAPDWRLEEALADAHQTAGRAGAQAAQVGAMVALALLEHALVPDEQDLLASACEGGDAVAGLLPEPVGNELRLPVRRAQQIAEAFGAGRSVTRRSEIAAKLAEEEGEVAMTPDEQGLEGVEEGDDETAIKALVEGA